MQGLFRRKSLDRVTEHEEGRRLVPTLSWPHLVALGIGLGVTGGCEPPACRVAMAPGHGFTAGAPARFMTFGGADPA